MKGKQSQKLPTIDLHLPLVFSEKINPKKEVVIRTQEEINLYRKAVGYRKARIKRYGKVPAKKAK